MNQARKEILNGWKEIAAYLGRDPRTVERWEKQRSLPVRRLPGSGRSTVYARVSELDAWMASSPPRESAFAEPAPTATAAAVTGAAAQATGMDERRGTGRLRVAGLRWVGLLAAVLLVCWGALAAVGWRRRHGESQPAMVAPAAHAGAVVPASTVFGVEELYLRGCYDSEIRTPESLRRAEAAFREAIARDPRYAPAYAGLASTFLLQREYSVVPDAVAYAKAAQAAQKALDLDPNLPQAHAAMGFVDFFSRWDGASAERQFRRALQVNPNLSLAHHWYGSMLLHEGRFREGLGELNLAQQLDPSSAAILTTRAFALGLSGKPGEASDLLKEAITAGHAQSPSTMHAVLASLSLMEPRDIPRYLAEMTLAAELRQDTASAAVMLRAAKVYRTRGEDAMWHALLQEEQKRHAADGPTYARARYEAELGEHEQALDDLTGLCARRDPALIGVMVDPLFASLHSEPRFLQLQAAMGLPVAAAK